MAQHNEHRVSLREVTALCEENRDERDLIGVTTSGTLVHKTVDDLDNYCALIEHIVGSDKTIDNYYIKGNSGGMFFNPNHNVYSRHTVWTWKLVSRDTMDYYAKFLETKSEKYLLLAQRKHLNG